MPATYTVTEGRDETIGFEGTEDSLSMTWEKTYFVEISGVDPTTVTTTDVVTASGLPTVNKTTYSSNGKIIPFVICRRKTAKRDPKRLARWTVSCSFKSPNKQGATEADNTPIAPPTNLTDITPREVPIFGETEKVLYTDIQNTAILTPSGRFWSEPVVERIPTLTIQLTQYETAPVLYTTLLDRLLHVNSGTYRGQPRYDWLITGIEAVATEVELGAGITSAVLVTYEISHSPNLYGWKAERALIDTHHNIGTQSVPKWKPFQDEGIQSLHYGHVTVTGVKRASQTGAPDYLQYEPFKEINYSTFLQA